jgi:hypothetical protein
MNYILDAKSGIRADTYCAGYAMNFRVWLNGKWLAMQAANDRTSRNHLSPHHEDLTIESKPSQLYTNL